MELKLSGYAYQKYKKTLYEHFLLEYFFVFELLDFLVSLHRVNNFLKNETELHFERDKNNKKLAE